MNKRWAKKGAIALAIILILGIVANLALHLWLQHKLPEIIKKNSDYVVSYQSLQVSLITGSIVAQDISIETKHPENQEILRLKGKINALEISRFGIYRAVFKKEFYFNELFLDKPDLQIILARPKSDSEKRKTQDLLKNIRIDGGNIQVFTAKGKKLLSVNQLDLEVQNIRMTEKSIESVLPLAFDHYNIQSKDFFYQPDDLYIASAKSIKTEKGKMVIDEFRLIPQVTPQQFEKSFPERKNMFRITSKEVHFTDIQLNKNIISMANFTLEQPEILMYTATPSIKKKKKRKTPDLKLDDIVLNNARIEIRKTNGETIFGSEKVNIGINKFIFDQETSKETIPFAYADFKISGENISFAAKNQKGKIGSISLTPKSGKLNRISILPLTKSSNNSSLQFTGNQLAFTTNDWNFKNNTLHLDIENITVDGAKGSVRAAVNSQPKKTQVSTIHFPVKIRNIVVKNSDFTYINKEQPLTITGLTANVNSLKISQTDQLVFDLGNYSITARNLHYKTRFYNIKTNNVNLNPSTIQVADFTMIPTVSRSEFIRMIPVEKDLYNLKAPKISIQGKWNLLSKNKSFNADQITIQSADANIFRSKIPKDDSSVKPMYSELLRRISFPFTVRKLELKNALLEYEEDTEKSEGPGKLSFGNFNLTAQNINSGKRSGNTKIPIRIQCRFMNASPMDVTWNLDTASKDDRFQIKGSIADLPAQRINPFIEPYLEIRATGSIDVLSFDFNGNKSGIQGEMQIKHEDLKVDLLKETGEKKKVLSAIVNIFVKSDSGSLPDSVEIKAERDPTRSFFNLFWKGIEDGLKKTLIGISPAEKKETEANSK
ncbi:MAG: hypothetical protein ITF99_01250 [Chryseobacterium sp.]|nr:hypothetical protein [Chryseobacterium sp.]